jgi:hypothetical protein
VAGGRQAAPAVRYGAAGGDGHSSPAVAAADDRSARRAELTQRRPRLCSHLVSPASGEDGPGPGRSTPMFHVSAPGSAPARRAGSSPARTSDDFPLADGPSTARNRDVTRRWRRRVTSPSRPKKRSGGPPPRTRADPHRGQTSDRCGRSSDASAGPRVPSPTASSCCGPFSNSSSPAPRPEATAKLRTRLTTPRSAGSQVTGRSSPHRLAASSSLATGLARSSTRERDPRLSAWQRQFVDHCAVGLHRDAAREGDPSPGHCRRSGLPTSQPIIRRREGAGDRRSDPAANRPLVARLRPSCADAVGW